jgi:hypothetical protein
MRCWTIGSLCMAGALGLMRQSAAGESYVPRVGQRHADFTLPSIRDGTAISLSQFRGRKVLLIQFAAW